MLVSCSTVEREGRKQWLSYPFWSAQENWETEWQLILRGQERKHHQPGEEGRERMSGFGWVTAVKIMKSFCEETSGRIQELVALSLAMNPKSRFDTSRVMKGLLQVKLPSGMSDNSEMCKKPNLTLNLQSSRTLPALPGQLRCYTGAVSLC